MTSSGPDLESITAQRVSRQSVTTARKLAKRWGALAFAVFALNSRDCRAGGMAFDASGNLFLAQGQSVLKFATDGTKTTFATGLENASGLAFDHKGNLLVADVGSMSVYRFAPDGKKSPYLTGVSAYGLALDAADNLFLPLGSSILKFTPDGTKSTFAKGLGAPLDLAFDATGNLFVLDPKGIGSAAVYKFDSKGAQYPFLSEIHLQQPSGLAIDGSGNVYLTEIKANDSRQSILQFSPDGKKSTFAAVADAYALGSLAVDKSGNVFVFNGDSLTSDRLLKFNARGAHTSSVSPDGHWQYQIVSNQFPEIARVGASDAAVDLSEGRDAPHPNDSAVSWAPDSKSFAFEYSPLHMSHTSYEMLVFYRLHGDEWKPAHALAETESKLSQLAQLGKSRLPKKLAHDLVGERDDLAVRRWIDADTVIISAHSTHEGGKRQESAATYLFTLKFDAQGNWKIIDLHPPTAKEETEP